MYPTTEELARRERARKVYIKKLRRAQRICLALNAAIQTHDKEKIKHWQKISDKFYNIQEDTRDKVS